MEALTTFRSLDWTALFFEPMPRSNSLIFFHWGLSDFAAWKSQRLALHSWIFILEIQRPCMGSVLAAKGQSAIDVSPLSPWIESVTFMRNFIWSWHDQTPIILSQFNGTSSHWLSFPVSLSLPCTSASWGYIQEKSLHTSKPFIQTLRAVQNAQATQLSKLFLLNTLWTMPQGILCHSCSRQEGWVGLPCPPPEGNSTFRESQGHMHWYKDLNWGF